MLNASILLDKAQEAKNLHIFMEQFGDAIQLAANVYCDHRWERGDAWDTMSAKDIAGRLFEEFTEWVKEWNDGNGAGVKQVAEAVDVVNFALMFIQQAGKLARVYAANMSAEKAAVKRSNHD